ncbi:MAG TPA: hypothetical protein DHV26_17200 [Cytophagales bacterium]|nr:hypothetical protein [Cytophagales bacterium]HRG09573.1 hypothetical protein [Cyclobacteriaceae bacterium]
MKRILNITILVISSLVFVTCDNYSFPESPYPVVKTLETVRSQNGVILRASIIELGTESITDHGFLWNSSQALVQLLIGTEIRLGPTSTKGIYEAELTGLNANQEYWFTAIVEGDGFEQSSKVVSFKID